MAFSTSAFREEKPARQRRQEFWEFYLLRGFDAAYKKYFGDSKYVITKKIVKQIIKRVLRKLQ